MAHKHGKNMDHVIKKIDLNDYKMKREIIEQYKNKRKRKYTKYNVI